MPEYIAILRGINVSGQKKIQMADLKTIVWETGCENVRTYIQSGNIVFEHKSNPNKKLAAMISESIKEGFGFDVPVIVLTASELAEAVSNNPFIKDKSKNPDRMYLTFLDKEPSAENVMKFEKPDYGSEEFEKIKKVVYLYVPNGYGRAKLNNNLVESKLKVRATTRNWKTVNKLLQMLSTNDS